jgi:hypothetical protein
MRTLIVLSLVTVFASFAFGQVTIISGEASNLAPRTYTLPVGPSLTTPEQQFATPTLQVGASNATAGLVAGASNSTADTVVSSGELGPAESYSAPEGTAQMSAQATDWGAAMAQDSFGVAQLAAGVRNHKGASRTFTNDDIDRLKK